MPDASPSPQEFPEPLTAPHNQDRAPVDLEFRQVWHRLPNKTFFFVLFVAWLALFQFLGNSTFGYIDTGSLLRWMLNAYLVAGSDDNHGLVMPLVVLGLFWWKRDKLLAADPRLWWPGMLLLACGLVLHVIGYAVQQPRLSIVGMLGGLYGMMGLAWGPGWLRASFFPFCLLAFCIPISTIVGPITFRLQLLVSWLVELISHQLLDINIVRNGNDLRDPTGRYQYEVVAACSGIRSFVAIFALATIYAFVLFRVHWKRLILLGSAVPFAVLGNLLRVLMIILAAETGGQDAGNRMHENWFFSLVPYVPALVGLLTLGYLLEGHWRRRAKGASR